jgi:hypothetical protein
MKPSERAADQYSQTTGNLTGRIAIHTWNTNPQSWFSWLSPRLPLAGDVLEVGAGTGELITAHHSASQRITALS